MNNIYLVGFMGAGKTTIGRLLARRLGWAFIDLDREIEEREGKQVREIFAEQGEAHFRQVEGEELSRISCINKAVVALGGGAFVDPANREIVLRTGTSVWLDAPLDVLHKRCESENTRPLFASATEMEKLLHQRCPLYALAQLRIDVSTGTVESITDEILEKLSS